MNELSYRLLCGGGADVKKALVCSYRGDYSGKTNYGDESLNRPMWVRKIWSHD